MSVKKAYATNKSATGASKTNSAANQDSGERALAVSATPAS
ncbi:MAG: hypothetical protein QOF74_1938 [Caballeronia mineralivorans]|nr:hypothetical protein [Caballeronia mineralivorans]